MVHHTQRPIIEANRVYSREEVAEILNVSLSTVKRLIASRRLRVSQPPGMRRVLIRGQHILDLLVESEVIPSDDDDETDSAESAEAAETAN
ncbi:MAG: DNA-binding protein [Chloroflexi bacterium CFX4]|nr:DNA-binding protein [Chloroflexi bacterium CFX4]MDL1922882.1 helix-turn-helix domain-containing protein [Chloroflexi bacterium CFX3]